MRCNTNILMKQYFLPTHVSNFFFVSFIDGSFDPLFIEEIIIGHLVYA